MPVVPNSEAALIHASDVPRHPRSITIGPKICYFGTSRFSVVVAIATAIFFFWFKTGPDGLEGEVR